MVDKVVVTVTDLEKKHTGKLGYENMYSVAKHVYMDDGKVDTILSSSEEILKLWINLNQMGFQWKIYLNPTMWLN